MSTNNIRRLRAAVILVLSAFGVTTFLVGIFPTVFQSWDSQTIDRLFLLREQIRPSLYDSTIVHIDIDNSSIKKLSYYFPRRLHADLFDVTRRIDFSSIAYDIIFAQRLNAIDDTLLLEAVQQSGRGYFPVAFELKDRHTFPRLEIEERKYLDSTAWILDATDTANFYRSGATLLTWPALSYQSRGVGFISVSTDPDGVFRRVPLVIRYKNSFYPSMVFRLACDKLKVTPDNIIVTGGHSITLRNAVSRTGDTKDIVIPIDEQGNMIINWIGPWERMTHISFVSLLEAAEDRDEVEALAERYSGAIGIVGDVSTGISDIGPTPFEQSFPLVGLHANTLNTILTENFLRRLPFTFILGIEIVLALLMISFSYKFSSSVYTISSLGLLFTYGALSCTLFVYYNIITVIIHPMISIILSTGSVLTYRYITEEKEKEQLRARFESYFPPAVVKQMLENPELRMTKPKSLELTIMFSDIKSFTTHSSTMTPEDISASLSEYFEAMTSIVFKYEGTVDKFIGDGLMVFYGAPEQQEDHALRCVKAAIEMQKKCRELKEQWMAAGKFPLQIRIGINTGEVVVGDLGSERRKEYTVIGSPVNLSQRLESNAPVEGILISESTYHYIKDSISTRTREPIFVKGLDTPIVVYEVVIE
ncbi:MAG: adenylate/guanylate cyclase domain-containing protein [Bacteroidota bacterium]|nr:adenylate/guanylate cyclase domain-containing protein [Bacteroidota bacterium]